MTAAESQPPGPGVDAQGRTARDPSVNVIALAASGLQRQDDLREKDSAHLREVSALRSGYEEKIAELRERHQLAIQDKETKRLDAVRAVDQQRGIADAAAAEIRATALQTQVALSADAVRNAAVAATQAQQENLTRLISPLQASIEDLRRAQYEQQGQRQQIVERRGADEDLKPLVDKIEKLIEAQAMARGGREQIVEKRASNAGVYVVVGLGATMLFLIIGLIGLYLTIKTATGK